MQGESLAPAIAAGMFVAVKQSVLTASLENLRMALAAAAILLPVTNIVLRKTIQNEVCSTRTVLTGSTSLLILVR